MSPSSISISSSSSSDGSSSMMNRDVAHLTREALGNGIDRFLDELAKAFPGHFFATFLGGLLRRALDSGFRGLRGTTALIGLVTKPVR